MRGRQCVTLVVAVVAVMMLPWLREVAIENLLLIGRQDAANVAQSLPEQLMPPMHIILPRLHHFEPGIAQDIARFDRFAQASD